MFNSIILPCYAYIHLPITYNNTLLSLAYPRCKTVLNIIILHFSPIFRPVIINFKVQSSKHILDAAVKFKKSH